MYKLLIVDDEQYVREGLSKFDWNGLGIELAGVYEHGLSAFQSVRENPMDIILSDIRMPIMDGLELIRKVSRDYPFTKLVVLSGYDDFDYARTCIQNGVADYILKPVDNEQLCQTFTRVVDKLNAEKQQQMKLRELERKAGLSAGILRKEFLKRLLLGNLSPEEIEEGASYSEVLLESGCFTVCLLQMDNIPEKKGSYSEKDWKLIFFAIDNILKEVWEDCGYGYYLTDSASGCCCLIAVDPKIQEYTELLIELVNNVKDSLYRIGGLLRTTISGAIGKKQCTPEAISISRCQAEGALRQKKLHDDVIAFDSAFAEITNTSESTKVSNPPASAENSPSASSSGKRHIIETARKYIDSNFMYSITLSDVAAHSHVNASYLSSIFAEIMGVNFVNYLTRCRMEKAKLLLSDPQYKIYEIGEMVGYENPRYFSETFKRNTGKTPFEYRSSY